MRSSESSRYTLFGVAYLALIAASVMGASNSAFAQSVLASGQAVAGGGRSVATNSVVVGAIVLGPSGTSSDGASRIDGGVLHYPQPLMAAYLGNPVQVVDIANRTLKIAVAGESGQIEGRFFHRLGGQAAYVESPMTLGSADTLAYDLPASLLTLRGLEYYFEIERSGSTILQGTPLVPYAFITRLNNEAGPTLPDATYRMIGFPFDVAPGSPAQVFEDDLGDYDPRVWRLGRFNPQSESYDEYPNVGTIARGRGYWLITRDGERVDASGQSAIPDTTDVAGSGLRYGRITVEPGWNQIATPFAFPVAWDDRQAESGIESVLWAYTSGSDSVTSYVTTQTLEPFAGYWLFNSASTPRRLLLPFAETAVLGAAQKSTQQDGVDWRIHLAATAGKAADLFNVAGTAPGAQAGADGSDFSEPPVIGDYVSLAFSRNPSAEDDTLLAGDFRPSVETFHIFDLLLRGNVTAPVRLAATTEGQFAPGTRIVLVDSEADRVFDLRETPEFVLSQSTTAEGVRYKLLVGDGENPAFPDPTSTTIPRTFALAQNYPNPFNSSTTIEFDVSSAGAVKISVFDVLGRAVRVLTNSEYAQGRYTLGWNGNDEHGRPVASGMYVYQLVGGGVTLTRKMVVLK